MTAGSTSSGGPVTGAEPATSDSPSVNVSFTSLISLRIYRCFVRCKVTNRDIIGQVKCKAYFRPFPRNILVTPCSPQRVQ